VRSLAHGGYFLILFCAACLQAASVGRQAPAFALTTLRGEKRAPADYRGKIVFINFWASWCGPCEVELPELNRLAAHYAGKVRVVAINVDEDRGAAQRTLAKLGLRSSHLDILLDPRSKAASAYQLEGMPASFILDAHGAVRYKHVGFHGQDPEQWRREIDEVLGNPSKN